MRYNEGYWKSIHTLSCPPYSRRSVVGSSIFLLKTLMNSFSEISLSAPLRNNLLKHGYSEPTPVQALAIEPALAGNDVVATAQTGTGKTLAFVLPVIQTVGRLIAKQPSPSGIRAVILSPTRELALQTEETFAKMALGTGVRSAIAIGGLNERSQLSSIRKGAQVLIATPGRLYDFLSRQTR